MPHADNLDMGPNGGMAIAQDERSGDGPLWPRLLRLMVFLGTALLCWAPPLLIVYWLVG